MDNQQERLINIDYVICEICKQEMKQITYKHLKYHSLTVSQYKKIFPKSLIRCLKSKEIHINNQNKTNMEKYGVTRPLQYKDFKNKADNTLLNNFNVTNAYLIDNVQKKARLTCFEKYGAETPLQSKLYDKIQSSAQTEASKEKRKNSHIKTCLKKYGVTSNLKLKSCREKIKKTLIYKYNKEYPGQINNAWQKGLQNNLNLPNKPEKIIINILEDKGRYCGNGTFWIKLKNGNNKNPDFKINGCKKLIEHFGDYWHKGEDENILISEYKKVGFDCLVIWEHELKDLENVKLKIYNFIN